MKKILMLVVVLMAALSSYAQEMYLEVVSVFGEIVMPTLIHSRFRLISVIT